MNDKQWDDAKKEAVTFRQCIEREWYLNEMFLNSQFYIGIDTKTGRIREIKKRPSEVRRTINLIKKYSRVMARLITREEPQIEIKYTNVDKNEDKEEQVSVVRHTLLQWWRNNNLQNMTYTVVKDALAKYGAIELFWDEDKKDGLGDVSWERIDVWNLWLDPTGKIDLETGEFDGQFMYKEVVVPWSELEDNPKYKAGVIAQAKQAKFNPNPSENAVRDNLTYMIQGYKPNYKDMAVITVVYEREVNWEKLDHTDMEEGAIVVEDKMMKRTKYHITEKIGDIEVYTNDNDISEYPIKILYAEVDEKLYPRPLLSDQRDINKTVNDTYSAMAEYSRIMLRGRLLVRDGTVMSGVNTVDGQIVKWKGLQKPEQMKMTGIDNTQFSLLEKSEQLQQNIAGVSDGTLGTGNATSGLELNIRKSADMDNASESATALELFIKNITRYALQLMVQHRVTTIPVEIEGRGNEKIIKNVISGNVKDRPKDAIAIEMFDDLTIKVVPKSAFSDLALRTDMKELAEIGAIDRETLIEAYQTGSTADILERVRKAKAEAGGGNAEVEKAIEESTAENNLLLKGETITKYEEWKSDEAKHSALMKHLEIAKELVGGNNEKAKKAFTKHITETAKKYGVPLKSLGM